MPAPARSTNDAAICVTANSAQPAVGARRDPDAAVRQAEAVRRSGRRQTRHEREQHGGDHRQTDAHPQQRRIDGDIERAHRVARRVTRQQRDHRPRDRSRRAPRRRRRAAGSRRAASGAARRCWRPARRGSRARLRGGPSAPESDSRRSSRRSTKISADAASSTSRTVRAGEMIWSRRRTASIRKSAVAWYASGCCGDDRGCGRRAARRARCRDRRPARAGRTDRSSDARGPRPSSRRR